MTSFDDIEQIVKALIKAGKFISNNENDIFVIVQLVPCYIPSTNIEFAEALYGKEETVVDLNLEKCYIRRRRPISNNAEENGGFFYSDKGKHVDGYIKASETENFFSPYRFELFTNDNKNGNIELLNNLIHIEKIYDSKTYIE